MRELPWNKWLSGDLDNQSEKEAGHEKNGQRKKKKIPQKEWDGDENIKKD